MEAEKLGMWGDRVIEWLVSASCEDVVGQAFTWLYLTGIST